MKKYVLPVLAVVLVAAPALAQAPARKAPTGAPLPKTGTFVFSNACQIMPIDDAFGNTVRLVRTAPGDTLVFGEVLGGLRINTEATDLKVNSPAGKPTSEITFSVQSQAEKAYRMEPRQLSGTISTTEVRLTQLGVENAEPINLPRVAANFRPGDCPQ